MRKWTWNVSPLERTRNGLTRIKSSYGLTDLDLFSLSLCLLYLVMIVGVATLGLLNHSPDSQAAPTLPTPKNYQIYKLVYTEDAYDHTEHVPLSARGGGMKPSSMQINDIGTYNPSSLNYEVHLEPQDDPRYGTLAHVKPDVRKAIMALESAGEIQRHIDHIKARLKALKEELERTQRREARHAAFFGR